MKNVTIKLAKYKNDDPMEGINTNDEEVVEYDVLIDTSTLISPLGNTGTHIDDELYYEDIEVILNMVIEKGAGVELIKYIESHIEN